MATDDQSSTMTQSILMERLHDAWNYPLFDALYGRRSRRFGMGFEINEGPFRCKSTRAPLSLNEIEEALLVAAGVGVTGAPLWDTGRPPAFRTGPGRTYASTSRGRRTALFLTNDDGTYVIDPGNVTNANVREASTPNERETVLSLYRDQRKDLATHDVSTPA